jgi:hypothetical protein
MTNRGGLLVAGKLTPPGAVPRLASELDEQETVSLQAFVDYAF